MNRSETPYTAYLCQCGCFLGTNPLCHDCMLYNYFSEEFFEEELYFDDIAYKNQKSKIKRSKRLAIKKVRDYKEPRETPPQFFQDPTKITHPLLKRKKSPFKRGDNPKKYRALFPRKQIKYCSVCNQPLDSCECVKYCMHCKQNLEHCLCKKFSNQAPIQESFENWFMYEEYDEEYGYERWCRYCLEPLFACQCN